MDNTTPSPLDEELQPLADKEETVAETQEKEQVEEEYPIDFSLNYRLNEEDYFQFQLTMAQTQLTKNRKRNTIMGWVEVSFGILYIAANLIANKTLTSFQIVLGIMLIAMGAYGICYFKYFFEKQLRKASVKQFKSNDYFQHPVRVDFYPNKCVEYINRDGETTPSVNYWHGIQGVQSTNQFVMVMLEVKRCLLIPKAQIADQLEMVEDYMDKICENFEKPRGGRE